MSTSYKIILFILFLTMVILLWAGALQSVKITEETNDLQYAVYLKHQGSTRSAPATLFEVQRYLKEKGLNSDSVFFAYFQDHRVTPAALRTTWVGVVVHDPIEVEAPYELYAFEPRENIKATFQGHPVLSSYKTRSRLDATRQQLSLRPGFPWIEISRPHRYGQYIVEVWTQKEFAQEQNEE